MRSEVVEKRLVELYRIASSIQAKEDLKYFMGSKGNRKNDDKLRDLYSKIKRLEAFLESKKITNK